MQLNVSILIYIVCCFLFSRSFKRLLFIIVITTFVIAETVAEITTDVSIIVQFISLTSHYSHDTTKNFKSQVLHLWIMVLANLLMCVNRENEKN